MSLTHRNHGTAGTLCRGSMSQHADKWIVVGGSESAKTFWPSLREDHPDAKVITTNYGHLLVERPDVYFLADMVGCEMFGKVTFEFQKLGTHLITYQRAPAKLKQRGIAHFDEFLPMKWRGGGVFTPGHYTDWCMSGLFTMQYALNNGGKELHIIGHEGYQSQDTRKVKDHWSGQHGPTNGQVITRDVIATGMQAMINACPDVRFIYYGDLIYSPQGENVEFVREQVPA